MFPNPTPNAEYEPWMDDFGRQPHGVEFEAEDQLCSLHPEVWLDPDQIRDIREKEAAEAELKKKKAASKKEKKSKKEKQKKERAAEAAVAAAAVEEKANTSHKKKGIASKKNMEEVDEVTQIAAILANNDEDVDIHALEDDDLFDFDFDGNDGMGDIQL